MNEIIKTSDTYFLGHPRGLVTLFLTEMWERMSFYGMRGLLVLFMTREITEGGMNLSAPEAMAIYGIYGASVYFLCVPGGWIADKIFGAQKTVLYGAIIITLGHYVLAIPSDKTFFLGLVLVSIGTGLLKPNISTIVGQLYKPGDLRIDSGYTIFYMSINIGSMLGFLVCGYLGEKVGWHWGFGAAGVGMTFGVLQYIFTKDSLGEAGKKPNLSVNEDRAKYVSLFKYASAIIGLILITSFLGLWSIDPELLNQLTVYLILIVAASYFIYLFTFAGLSDAEKNNIKMLLLLFFGSVLFWAGFDQGGSSLNLFAKDFTDLYVFGWEMPATFLQVANPLMVVIFAPFFAAFWITLGKRNLDPDTPQKFALGCFLMAIGFLAIIFGVEAAMQNGKAGVQFLLITYLFHTLGELCLSPVGLSATAKYSPKRYRGQMMGIWFLSSSLAAGLAGLIASRSFESGISSMPDLFNQIIIALCAVGVFLLVANRFVKATPLKEENQES
jgi:POT family proton-dependent oligopeptide transporter